MSYSFTVVGSSRAHARALVKAELDRVVEAQPVHAKDRSAAEEAANYFISLVREDPDRDFSVRMHGSVSAAADGLVEATVGVTVSQVAR